MPSGGARVGAGRPRKAAISPLGHDSAAKKRAKKTTRLPGFAVGGRAAGNGIDAIASIFRSGIRRLGAIPSSPMLSSLSYGGEQLLFLLSLSSPPHTDLALPCFPPTTPNFNSIPSLSLSTPSQVGSINHHGAVYGGHYNGSVMNKVDSLAVKIYGKSAYTFFTNGSFYTPTAERFGLIPLPSSVLASHGMEAEGPEGSVIEKGRPFRFLAGAVKTKYTVGPIKSVLEVRDFFTELKKLQKPSDLSLYSTKPDFVALARSLNALVAEPLLAPDGSTIYDPQLLRSTPADQRRSYHLANQVFAFWNAAKRGHESRALFRAEGAVLEEVEGYLQPEAREIELGVGTHQERFALPSPAGASRPAPVRSGTLSAAERTASQDLARRKAATLGLKKVAPLRNCQVCIKVGKGLDWDAARLATKTFNCSGRGKQLSCQNLADARRLGIHVNGCNW